MAVRRTRAASPEDEPRVFVPNTGDDVGSELDRDIRRLVERSTSAQGVSFHVADTAILARVATLVQAVLREDVARRAS